MASVAESSIASVPLSKLAQLRDEITRQDQSGDNAQQPEADDETHISGTVASATKDASSTIPESANAYQTPTSSPRPPPRLANSRSAPPSEMEAMLHPSPSQEAFTNLTRANSFHGYPAGDTQPMESQVYRDFHASTVMSTTTTPKKAILQVQTSPDGDTTYNTIQPDNSPKTCQEGEAGYVDFENVYSPGRLSTSSHVDDYLADAQTQQDGGHEFARPAMPETPALAGNKRNINGEIVTSSSTTKKTPGFSQLFGGHDKVQMLSATQLFDQTQAPSSPQPEEPRSDPVVTRPSPIIHNHASLSSPVLPMTSPFATMHGRPSTAMEPRGNYTSLAESQKRKQQIREELRMRDEFSDDAAGDDFEEEVDREYMRHEQERRRRELHEHAKSEWSNIRVSSRPSSRPTSRQNSSQQQRVTIDLVTPAPDKQKPMVFDDIEDDIYQSDEDAPMQGDPPDDVQISDDEYDELGQAVLRSQPNNDEGEYEESTHDHDDAEMEEAAPHEPSPADEGHKEVHDPPVSRSEMPTQHSAITDSQPMGAQMNRKLPSQQVVGASSIPSVIPASQLGAKPTQDQQAVAMENVANEPNEDETTNVQDVDMPSSPPHEAPGLHTEISNVSEDQTAYGRTIPESDLPDSDNENTTSPNRNRQRNTGEKESNDMFYSTARTHASASGASPRKIHATASPLKVFESQNSKVYSQSPRTAAGVRHFADIAGAASPPKGSNEIDIDVDAIVSDVVTADDQDFMEIVSTLSEKRRSKRRKIQHEDSEVLSAANVSEARKQEQPVRGDNSAQPELQASDEVVGKTVAFEEPLQDRPSKANELQAATPPVVEFDDSTPDSVKKREQAGATAASQLLSRRRSTPKKALKVYGKSSKRQGSAKDSSPVSAKTRKAKEVVTSPTRSLRGQTDAAAEAPDAATSIEEAEQAVPETDELTEAAVEPVQAGAVTPTNDVTSTTTRAPNRVFAVFKGNSFNCWPASCLGASADGSAYRIKFDDGTIVDVEKQHVCRLELHVGDAVRVDLKDMRNTWQVVGFGATMNDDAGSSVGTDICGHQTVKIQPKSSRNSAANAVASDPGDESNTTEVAISNLYLTRTMWPSFADRLFVPSAPDHATSRTGTPRSGGVGVEISASRSGRSLIPTAKAAGTRTANLRDESASRPGSPSVQGLFASMAFAISYGSNEGEKAEVTRLIKNNGGIIFEQGFDELFDLPNLDDAPPTSPAKKSPKKTDSASKDTVSLQLKPEYNKLGLVALIADRHSRRAKYVQALALGLPTLSGKWIFDSLNQTRNPSKIEPLSWPKYLLPAGESSYLSGAIRSRTLTPYSVSDARLSTTIANRDILLHDEGVLIVASKKSGKSSWERRKAFAFLTLALGASWVKRVGDFAEARGWVSKEPKWWRWVYVDGDVGEASKVLFGKGGGAGGGKKRKRDEGNMKVDEKGMWAMGGDGKVRVVGDEFVVQSLILGALVD